jgi:threonine synthase
MPYVSTRGLDRPPVPLGEAVARGLAPDGGLYVPTALPSLTPEAFEALRGGSIADLATALIAPLAAETFDASTLARLMASALDFPVPLVRLADDLYVLELFHGPTLAFKDFGARTMARWLAAVTASSSGDQPLTVLVATSGDTGGAVAQAFHGVAGTRVVVLYPHGRVSRVQEVQFTTLGGNVRAVAVDGTFDDCQRLVKAAFADAALRHAHRLTSANSINIGRLLPQMSYYASAVLQLPAGAPAPTIVVPSGNLGNLTAGVMAARRGTPIGQRPVPALPDERPLHAAGRRADAGQRDGRRASEQPRAPAVAVPRRRDGDGARDHRRCRQRYRGARRDRRRRRASRLHGRPAHRGRPRRRRAHASRGPAARGAVDGASREVPRGGGAGAGPRGGRASGSGGAAVAAGGGDPYSAASRRADDGAGGVAAPPARGGLAGRRTIAA